MRKIDQHYLVDLTRELVTIPSVNPPGKEKEVAELLFQKMTQLGMDVELQECADRRPNVVGVLKGRRSDRTFLLNGHIDVVPAGDPQQWDNDPFSASLENGYIYGRGSADMKGGLASMLGTVKALVDSGIDLNVDVIVAGVIDEEHMGLGTKRLVRDGIKADVGVIGEPTDLVPLRGHKGILQLAITTRGQAIHSSRVRSQSSIGINAIYKMSTIIQALEAFLVELEKQGNALLGNPTVSIGTIIGGTKTNVVPDMCTITVDRRLLPKEDPEQAKEEICKIIRGLKNNDSMLHVEVNTILYREGCVVDEKAPVVSLARKAVENVTGSFPSVAGFVATSDMAILVNDGKIPTILLGPGSLAQAHVVNEHVPVQQIVDAAKIYTHMILATDGKTLGQAR